MANVWDWGATGAAWVQAVGSIVAVLVAIAVPVALRRLDRKRAREVEVARPKAIGAITNLAVDALTRLRDETAQSGLPGAVGVDVEILHDVQNAADAVDAIEIDKLGSSILVANVATVRRCVRRARGLVADFLPVTGSVLTVPFDFVALLDEAASAQAAIEKEISAS